MLCCSLPMQNCYRQEGGYLLCCNALSDLFALFIILCWEMPLIVHCMPGSNRQSDSFSLLDECFSLAVLSVGLSLLFEVFILGGKFVVVAF